MASLSPTNSLDQLLTGTRKKLKELTFKKKLNKRKKEAEDKLKELVMNKAREDGSSSCNLYTSDEDPDSTESEIEDPEVSLLLEDPRKKKEEEEERLYELMIKFKVSQCIKDHHVCPEALCAFTNAKEEKVADHVITLHGKSKYVEKAKEDIQKIKIEKEEKKKDQEGINDKRAQEKKEEKLQRKV